MWDAGPGPCSAFPSSAFSNPAIWNFLFKWLNYPLAHLPSLRNTSTKESATFTLPLVLSPPSFLSLQHRTLVFNWASQRCPSPPCTEELTGTSQTWTCGFYCSESTQNRPEASHCDLHWGQLWLKGSCTLEKTCRQSSHPELGLPQIQKEYRMYFWEPLKSVMCSCLILLHVMRISCVCVSMYLLLIILQEEAANTEKWGREKHLVCDRARKTEILGNPGLHQGTLDMALSLSHPQASTMQQVQAFCLQEAAGK